MITEVPETRYARSGAYHIAYQVVGEGPLDVVFVPGWISHLELAWEEPAVARFYRRLASFSRLILLDKRGTGLSDAVPPTALPTLEERMDDVRAVMDAAGSSRAALLGISEGGPMNLLFAATYPERTHALVLIGSTARFAWAEDYPSGATVDQQRALLEHIEEGWGKGVLLATFMPSRRDDAAARQFWARLQRMAASPGAAVALLRMAYETDARAVLPAIRVPTLVLHRRGDRLIPAEQGRYLADHIAGARYVEVAGDDHLFFAGDTDALLDPIEEFLTGERRGGEPDRVLATIVFADIVDSTGRAAALGDQRWRETLEAYYALARRQLARFRGREIDTAGDGLFASFDGPARAVRCAAAIAERARPLGLEVRAGAHTGECEIIGEKLGGIAVHIGARIAALAGAGEILVSSTVKDLVAGSGLAFADRGVHTLRGVPGDWHLHALTAAR